MFIATEDTFFKIRLGCNAWFLTMGAVFAFVHFSNLPPIKLFVLASATPLCEFYGWVIRRHRIFKHMWVIY